MLKLTKKQQNHYLNLLESYKSYLDANLDRYNDSKKNYRGGERSGLSDTLSTIAKLEYILNKDKNKFIDYQNWAGEVNYDSFVRFILQKKTDATGGETRDFVEYFFMFLSTGNIKRAAEFASLTPEIVTRDLKPNNCLFIDLIHYLLKQLLQNNIYNLLTISKCIDVAQQKLTTAQTTLKGMEGYITIFQGIFDNNLDMIQQGFAELLAGHNYQCRQDGYYETTYQQHFFYWGLGLVNLCRYKGFDVQINHPLIPIDLIIPVNTSGDTLAEITKAMAVEKAKILRGEPIDNPILKQIGQAGEIEQKKIADKTCKDFNTTIEEIKYRKLNRINQYIDYIDPIKYQAATQAYNSFRFTADEEELAIQIIQHLGAVYNDDQFIAQGVQVFKLPCSYSVINSRYFSEFTYDYNKNYYLLVDNEPLKTEHFIDFEQETKNGFITSPFDCLKDYLTLAGYSHFLGRKADNLEFYNFIVDLIEKFKIKNINTDKFRCYDNVDGSYVESQFDNMDVDEYLSIVGKELYRQGYSLLNIYVGGEFYSVFSMNRVRYSSEEIEAMSFNELMDTRRRLSLPYGTHMQHYYRFIILENSIAKEVIKLLNKLSKLDNPNNIDLGIYGVAGYSPRQVCSLV